MLSKNSMTLEDFFTLTEMKGGLMSHSRVEELISVMQRDKDCIVNVNDAARQWSSVASTLAATENRDSLDHFVRLNGLLFLDRWLQDAQKFNNDTCDNSVEASISLLLGALKKLPIDHKRSISSGIGATVKKLLAHKNSGVQERARALFSCWSQEIDNYEDKQDMKEVDGYVEDRVNRADGTVSAESWCHKNPCCDNTLTERNTDGKPIGDEHQDSRNTGGSQYKSTGDLDISDSCNKDNNHASLDQEYKEDESRAQDLCTMPNSCQASISVMEETSSCPAEKTTSMGSCSILNSVEWMPSHILRFKDITTDAKEADFKIGSLGGNGKQETSVSNSSGSGSGSGSVSPADSVGAQQPVIQPDVLSNINVNETRNCMEKTLLDSVDGHSGICTGLKGMAVEPEIQKHMQNTDLEVTYKVSGPCSDVMQNSSFVRMNSGNLDNINSEKHDPEKTDDIEELSDELKLKAGTNYKTTVSISSPEIDANFSELKTKSDLDFEYGFDDALEVARQVAKEVEREVVDYRKQFCSSSSEKASEGRVRQPGSPDSINDERYQTVGRSRDEPPIKQNLIGRAVSPNVEVQLMDSVYVDKTENCMRKDDSSQVCTETLQKPIDEGKINLCDFDLNEACSEEVDHAVITFVSASKVAPAGVPKAPLHFEGELGWKGSAPTSAFRPAHSRRTPDCGKPLSVVGSSQSSKQRRVFLDIDLNATEGDGDGASHPGMGKQVLVSSDLPSGESSVEVSSRRAQRLQLDLNRIGDNEDNPSSDGRLEERFIYHHPIGSPSPASSSSSRQFPPRNIDLNGNPSLYDDFSDRQPGYSKCSISGGFRGDDPVVSIMGTRVAINRHELIPQTQTFLPSGRGVESPISAVYGRAENGLGTFAHPPPSLFSYNGFGMRSPVSLSPAIYGPGSVPCMVDSRGAPVLPQMIPSSSDVPHSQLPLFMSMSNPITGLNGVSRPSLDLNSGLSIVEAERCRSGGDAGQLFIPGQGILMEQMRSVSQHIGPGLGTKRKEPDGGGWELYPVGYKHQPPWF